MAKHALLTLALVALSFPASACDVYIGGHYRADGTYVRGHCENKPGKPSWNDYGPSRNYSELTSPYIRDSDGDGIINMYDTDDDSYSLFAEHGP